MALAARLRRSGHLVRGTTRDPVRARALERAGVEPFVGDPDRVGTLLAALDRTSVACVLLGSAVGDRNHLAAIHGDRLETLLRKLLDTTVRGVVYEASGTVPPAVLARGSELVRGACERSRVAYALLGADPGERDGWVTAAAAAIANVLG